MVTPTARKPKAKDSNSPPAAIPHGPVDAGAASADRQERTPIFDGLLQTWSGPTGALAGRPTGRHHHAASAATEKRTRATSDARRKPDRA